METLSRPLTVAVAGPGPDVPELLSRMRHLARRRGLSLRLLHRPGQDPVEALLSRRRGVLCRRVDAVLILPQPGSLPQRAAADEALGWARLWQMAQHRSPAPILHCGFDWAEDWSWGHFGSHQSGRSSQSCDPRPSHRKAVREVNDELLETLPCGSFFLDLPALSASLGKPRFYDFDGAEPRPTAAALDLLAGHLVSGLEALTRPPVQLLLVSPELFTAVHRRYRPALSRFLATLPERGLAVAVCYGTTDPTVDSDSGEELPRLAIPDVGLDDELRRLGGLRLEEVGWLAPQDAAPPQVGQLPELRSYPIAVGASLDDLPAWLSTAALPERAFLQTEDLRATSDLMRRLRADRITLGNDSSRSPRNIQHEEPAAGEESLNVEVVDPAQHVDRILALLQRYRPPGSESWCDANLKPLLQTAEDAPRRLFAFRVGAGRAPGAARTENGKAVNNGDGVEVVVVVGTDSAPSVGDRRIELYAASSRGRRREVVEQVVAHLAVGFASIDLGSDLLPRAPWELGARSRGHRWLYPPAAPRRRGNRLVILSDDAVHLDGATLRGNAVNLDYFHQLAACFDEALLVSIVLPDRRGVERPLEPLRLLPRPTCCLDLEAVYASPGGGALAELVAETAADTAVLSFNDEISLLLLQALLDRGAGAVLYLGKNPREIAAGLRAQGPQGVRRAELLDGTLRTLLPRLAAVLVRGEALAQRIEEAGGRAVLSRPAIPLLRGDLESRDDLFHTAPHQLLYAGTFETRKGLADLIAALTLLHEEEPGRYRLRLVGAGDEEEALRVRARDAGLAETVEFCGWTWSPTLMRRHYREADALVFPGHGPEGYPRVLDEAMTLGVPVVTTAVGGIRGSLEDGIEALLVPPEDPTRLAAAIRRLAVDTALRQRLTAAARKRMERHLAYDSEGEQHLDLLFEALVTATAGAGR
jgi:glycosyltransferase involved in cell wall biosynthesis